MEAVFQAAGSNVEGMGDGRNLIQIALFHPGREVAGGDAVGEDHDAGQAFGGPLRQPCRQQSRHHQREQRGQHNTPPQHVHRCRNAGKGVGQAHYQRAGGNSNVQRSPAPGAAHGLVVIDDRSDLGSHSLGRRIVLRGGNQPALGIEDGDFRTGGGGIQASDPLQ